MSLNKYLAEVRKRADAATPGPWSLDPECSEDYAYCDDVVGSAVLSIEGLRGFSGGRSQQLSNLAFAAHARTDIPLLLAIIEEQAKALATLGEVAGIVARRLDSIEYELEASVYTVADDEFATVFHARDQLLLAQAKPLEAQVRINALIAKGEK